MADHKPIVITHSDISMFLSCKRRWGWSYVHDFQKPEGLTGPLALGKRVHESIEQYYRDGKDPVEVHAELARRDVATMEADPTKKPWDLDQLYDDLIIGRNCIVAHQEWLAETGEDSMYEVYAVEETIEAPILDGRVVLRGKSDVQFTHITDGGLWSNDLKTSGAWAGGARELLERSYQHHVYLRIMRALHPDGPHIAGAIYTVMKKVKSPARASGPLVERFRVPGVLRAAKAKEAQIDRICAEMLNAIEEADTAGSSVLYPSPGMHCRYCEFKQPCEIADESAVSVRSMLDAEFTRGSRHARYGERETH